MSPSKLLDTAYSTTHIPTSVTESKKDLEGDKLSVDDRINSAESNGPAESMLLSKSSGKSIAESLGIPELAVEVERAVAQVERSVKVEGLAAQEKGRPEAAEKAAGPKQ